MKKLFLLLAALPLFAAVSCSDDKDLPDVDIYADIQGGTQTDQGYYIVQGQTLDIESVSLVNHGDKEATIGGVRYYLDYMPIATSIVAPYSIEIDTSNLAVGRHLLQAEMPVYAVGYQLCTGYISKVITVVSEAEDIPGTSSGTTTTTEHADLQTGGQK